MMPLKVIEGECPQRLKRFGLARPRQTFKLREKKMLPPVLRSGTSPDICREWNAPLITYTCQRIISHYVLTFDLDVKLFRVAWVVYTYQNGPAVVCACYQDIIYSGLKTALSLFRAKACHQKIISSYNVQNEKTKFFAFKCCKMIDISLIQIQNVNSKMYLVDSI